MSALTTTHWRRYTWGRSICEPVVPEQIDLQFRNRFSSGIYQALGYTSCWNLVFPFNLFSSMKLMFHHGSTANYGCTVLWSTSCWLIDSRWIGLFAHWFFFLSCSICLFPGSLTQSLQSLSVLQCWEESNTLSCSIREGNFNAGKTDTI